MIPLRIVLASLACLYPFSLAQEPKSDPDKTLIIISTSDIHGNLDNFPRLATLVKQYRAKYPHVLLMDSGDYFIGNPYVDDCEKRGEPLTILMNKLGYDVVTIGNHDLDYGQEALRDHIKGMPSTKFVITNASLSPTLENCFSPYVSIPIKGTSISVGVIGLADLQTTDVRRMTGISWKLPDEEDYKGITDRFRLHHNTINVILSHLGYGNDLKMMKYSPNIDVILGGHTHVMLPSGHLRTGTLLSHTGHSLSHVGVTEIIFSTEHPVSILSKSTRAVSLNEEIPDDPEVKEIVRRFSGNPLFNQQVGVAGVSHRNSVNDPVFQGAGNAGRNTVHDLVGKSGAVHFQNASFVIGRRHEFGQDQLFNVRFTHGAGDDLFPEGFQLVNVPDGNGSFVKMVFGPYSAAVVNGNIRMGGLLNGLAEKGAYGDVRDFFYLCSNFIFPQRGNGKPTGIDVRKALIDYLKQIKELLNPPPSKLPIIKDTTFAL